MRKIFLLLLVAVFMPRNTFAYDFEVDGIYYEAVSLTDFTCKVVSGDVKYSGEIVIPETVNHNNRTLTVVEIGENAFEWCTELTKVTISPSVTQISYNAFYRCSELFDVSLPQSIIIIGQGAFDGCKNLTNVTIPNSVKEIGGAAFCGCSSITSIVIPNSVTKIGWEAFWECSKLENVIIGNSVKEIGHKGFQDCTSLPNIIIPDNVTSIGNDAFKGCTSLKSIIIPNKMDRIDSGLFNGCSNLETVTIGNSVTEIQDGAFDNCEKLTTLYSLNTTPPSLSWSGIFTNNQYMTMNVYVPTEALEAYQKADYWMNFWNIKENKENEPEIKQEKCATPTIQYANGKLTFTCATKDAVCQSAITDTDVRLYSGNEIQLGVTYNISVYATKAGYAQSDVATATLCWIDAEPKTDGIGNGLAEVKALPVLIQSANGQISISGLDDGTLVCVYGANGVLAGSAVSNGGQVCVGTNMASGSIAIVKIGERSVKALVK